MREYLHFPNNMIKKKLSTKLRKIMPSTLYTVCIINSAPLWELQGALDALGGNWCWEEFWSQLQDQDVGTILSGKQRNS